MAWQSKKIELSGKDFHKAMSLMDLIVKAIKEYYNIALEEYINELEKDYLANSFGSMPDLLIDAEYITKVNAICMQCGDPANYSNRISSEKKHYKDVEQSAESVKDLFEGLGLTSKISKSNEGMPAVLAQTEQDPTKKTVLLYAHHDVQPVGDLSLWETDPFVPEIIDGRLYGRGSGDNKAGGVTHYEVIKALKDNPPVNIKVFIEGEA